MVDRLERSEREMEDEGAPPPPEPMPSPPREPSEPQQPTDDQPADGSQADALPNRAALKGDRMLGAWEKEISIVPKSSPLVRTRKHIRQVRKP